MGSYLEEAKEFIEKKPYKEEPYKRKNWGHSWHSICSYQGKLKPAIAHFLIKNFTEENDIVLDPFCGVGTIPFEACLQGRKGIGNDLSEIAYLVSTAKLNKPTLEGVKSELKLFKEEIEDNWIYYKLESLPDVDFGFNQTVRDYFHPETLRELLTARFYIKHSIPNITPERAMVFSALLHVLHGNRPYALSRTSHSLVPYAPHGEFIYKNIIEHVENKINLIYKETYFQNFRRGKTYNKDFTEIRNVPADVIITSPPFADSRSFYNQNWLRLWLCGWNKEDFKEASIKFLDEKQNKNLDLYYNFFKMCNYNLKHKGKLILHLGKTKKIDMAEELVKRSTEWFKEIYRGEEDVTEIEKHGIRDKGRTTENQYLFLEKL